MLEFKHYRAQYQYAPMLGQYVAEVVDLPVVLSFSATSLSELKALMSDILTDYETNVISQAELERG